MSVFIQREQLEVRRQLTAGELSVEFPHLHRVLRLDLFGDHLPYIVDERVVVEVIARPAPDVLAAVAPGLTAVVAVAPQRRDRFGRRRKDYASNSFFLFDER